MTVFLVGANQADTASNTNAQYAALFWNETSY